MSSHDRLVGRGRPTVPYPIQIDDSRAAQEALSDAQAALQIAMLSGASAERIGRAHAAVTAARAAYQACFEDVVLTAMAPADYEDLLAAHPPREGTDDEAWNSASFPRACFLACAATDLSTAEWETWLAGSCSSAERQELYSAAIAINIRVLDTSLPKDSTEIPV